MSETMRIAPLAMSLTTERWPLKAPFHISGYTFHDIEVLLVKLEKAGHVGQGEGVGVYYRSDRLPAMIQQLESLRTRIESGLSRDALQRLLPPGGARNALDCALWDLEAKLYGLPAWQISGLTTPHPLLTTFTCGADDPDRMALTAQSYTRARAIKLKLTGEPIDHERVRTVRRARPDVWLGVDANQGFTRASLDRLMPELMDARVEVIEQPFPLSENAWLEGLRSPIPIAADESVQSLQDLPNLAGLFQVINIKLDKCGGLTEALAMARAAGELGLKTMVGNMMGTSLAMAPAFLVGQMCDIVDLDGPVFLRSDRPDSVCYTDGYVSCPDVLWGFPRQAAS
jgi:L-alanine-DL-glutamate epimerase-like enolase superfamily enzyme